jgi:3-hydroxyisobutyrate dehydrogenase-like beta-hydroxyacid dehydrogenase
VAAFITQSPSPIRRGREKEVPVVKRIAFIGTGYMGARMARRLLDAEYPLTVYNRTREKTTTLAERGASVADTLRLAAEHADVVMFSLTDDTAVRDAVLGPNGALSGARRGSVFIDLSTVLPETSRELSAAARSSGVSLLDAPVSGSTPQAEQGSLLIFVGGERETYAASSSILDVLGRSVYIGPSGMGTTMKIVVNALLGLGIHALAEAVALGEKAGLDKGLLLDVLAQTSVISPAQHGKFENVRRDEYPPTFPLRLMIKDYGLILRLGQTLSVPLPAVAVAQQVGLIGRAAGGDEDFSTVVRTMERLSGVGLDPGRQAGLGSGAPTSRGITKENV